jgi:uncharacterized protein (TIGR04255 family)
MTATDLPTFANAPVNEVALSAQLEPISGFSAVHFGLFWEQIRSEYPRVEDQAPLGELNTGDPVQVRLQVIDTPPLPRVWFVDESESRLIQLQVDRLAANWRRQKGQEYPRYETIRPRFVDAWRALDQLLATNGLGPLRAEGCEVSYYNPLEPGMVWADPSQLAAVVAPWSGVHTDDYLPPASDVHFSARYPMTSGDVSGKLTIEASPARRVPDDTAMLLLNLQAVGEPPTADLDGVLTFLDAAHEWVVRGFRSITTPEMHDAWEVEQ